MKIRKGHVSNSSSSSFICNICGKIAFTMDGEIEDTNMACCPEFHTFCLSHLKEKNATSKISSDICPICKMSIISDQVFNNYVIKKSQLIRKTIEDEIKEKFKNYGEFKEYLEGENEIK